MDESTIKSKSSRIVITPTPCFLKKSCISGSLSMFTYGGNKMPLQTRKLFIQYDKSYRNMKAVFSQEIKSMRMIKINRLRDINDIKVLLPNRWEIQSFFWHLLHSEVS